MKKIYIIFLGILALVIFLFLITIFKPSFLRKIDRNKSENKVIWLYPKLNLIKINRFGYYFTNIQINVSECKSDYIYNNSNQYDHLSKINIIDLKEFFRNDNFDLQKLINQDSCTFFDVIAVINKPGEFGGTYSFEDMKLDSICLKRLYK